MPGFSVSVSGFSIRVVGDPEITQAIEKHLLPWLPRCVGPAPSDVVFSVDRVGSDDEFQIRSNSSVLHAAVRERDLFTTLQQAVDDLIISRLKVFAAVHAGVVVWREAAIVLPGVTHAGKTTLVRALIERGAEYCSDEFAMLDSAGQVHPWPRALMVRDHDLLQNPVHAGELGAKVRSRPARVALFAFLEHRPMSTFTVEPLTGAETLIHLLQNTPHILSEGPHLLRPLVMACKSASGVAGVRGEALEAARCLIEMV